MEAGMDAPITAAIITGSIAFVASVLSGVITLRSARKNIERSNRNAHAIKALELSSAQALKNLEHSNALRLKEFEVENDRLKSFLQRQKEVAVYTEPLARAAYDLQSRIWNMLEQGFLHAYLLNGTEQTQQYAVNNTIYLIAQYLCWVEIARRELQFIDLGEDVKTRQLLAMQDKMFRLWGTDRFPPPLRIFAGDQRALGEALIEAGIRGPTCMGYGAFQSKFLSGAHKLIESIRVDVDALPENLDRARERLTAVQHTLIDILDILDPNKIRFPQSGRTKV
jgi:hypothetical protein